MINIDITYGTINREGEVPRLELSTKITPLDETVLDTKGYESLLNSDSQIAELQIFTTNIVPRLAYARVNSLEDAIYISHIIMGQNNNQRIPSSIFKIERDKPIAVVTEGIREICKSWNQPGNIFAITADYKKEEGNEGIDYWKGFQHCREALGDIPHNIIFLIPQSVSDNGFDYNAIHLTHMCIKFDLRLSK